MLSKSDHWRRIGIVFIWILLPKMKGAKTKTKTILFVAVEKWREIINLKKRRNQLDRFSLDKQNLNHVILKCLYMPVWIFLSIFVQKKLSDFILKVKWKFSICLRTAKGIHFSQFRFEHIQHKRSARESMIESLTEIQVSKVWNGESKIEGYVTKIMKKIKSLILWPDHAITKDFLANFWCVDRCWSCYVFITLQTTLALDGISFFFRETNEKTMKTYLQLRKKYNRKFDSMRMKDLQAINGYFFDKQKERKWSRKF